MIPEIFAWLLLLPVSRYDATEDYGHRIDRIWDVAEVVAEVSRGSRLVAASLLVQADSESAFRLDVSRCECPGKQCDRGRAHGFWQHHRRTGEPESAWWAHCGESREAIRSGATLAAATFRGQTTATLPCAFASMGGNKATCDSRWAIERAAKAIELSAKLKPARKRKPRR